jgi:cell division septation protein DedD
MTIEEKDPLPPADDQNPELDPDRSGPQSWRHEPLLTGYEVEELYPEPDSDSPTDYTGEPAEDGAAGEESLSRKTALEQEGSGEVWRWHEPDPEPDPDAHWSVDSRGVGALDPEPDGEREREDDWDEAEHWEQETGWAARRETPESAEQWQEPAVDLEEPQEQSPILPAGLIAVAVLAVLLLAGGGYGVMEQRAAMQAEIQQLQEELAAGVSPREVAAGRDAVRELERRSAELQATVDRLTVENHSLRDTVADLRSELLAGRTAAGGAPPPAPATVAAAQPVASSPPPSNTATAGEWFVNFGSYNQRDTAQSWVTRLQPAAGSVTVTSGSKGGRTFYRVRVVGLSSKEQAERVAGQLQREYDLSKLWVGTQ